MGNYERNIGKEKRGKKSKNEERERDKKNQDKVRDNRK